MQQVIMDLLTKYGADNSVIASVQKSFRLQISNYIKKQQEKERKGSNQVGPTEQ